MTLTTLLILELWLIISLVRTLPPSSCTLSRSKRQVSFVLIFSLFFIFFYVSPFCHAKMMNKFNQEMYAKIKAKKNDPLSSLGKKMVRVIEKGTSITPATSVLETTRIAFPMTSLEDRGRGLWQRERRKWALRRPISGTMLELPWRGPNLLLLLKTLKRFLAFLLMGL